MKVYIQFIIKIFLKSFLYVSGIIFALVLILNLLTEIEFFKDINVTYFFPIYISFLNSPSLLFEMFPFIFLIATQIFFINLFKNHQIQTLKYSGLKNIKIIIILMITSLMTGVLLIVLFYNLSSNLKNIYLEMKNNYTSDNKYLAVITNNGLWIKDNVDKNINIINASRIDDRFLINASITELDDEFNVVNHIESEKIDISNKNWILNKAAIYKGNEKILKDNIKFYSNFDYERIQSLFSNLSSLSVMELFELRKNYILLNLSTTEINIQINKIASYPIYLSMMTVLAGIIMFNVRTFNSNILKISFGLFSSVLIYYMNNFFNVMGKTEKIPIIFSVWGPIIFLIIVNFIYTIKINEK